MGVKSARVEIQVCKSCGWTNKKIKKTLQALALGHPDALDIRQVSCLDECSDDPVVKVGSKCYAPAKPKKLAKAVEKLLR